MSEFRTFPEFALANFEISNTAAPQEHEHFNFWEWLASEVPYLHIIDGTQDEETVTSDVVTILGERGF